jgi:hypothetical protein
MPQSVQHVRSRQTQGRQIPVALTLRNTLAMTAVNDARGVARPSNLDLIDVAANEQRNSPAN